MQPGKSGTCAPKLLSPSSTMTAYFIAVPLFTSPEDNRKFLKTGEVGPTRCYNPTQLNPHRSYCNGLGKHITISEDIHARGVLGASRSARPFKTRINRRSPLYDTPSRVSSRKCCQPIKPFAVRV